MVLAPMTATGIYGTVGFVVWRLRMPPVSTGDVVEVGVVSHGRHVVKTRRRVVAEQPAGAGVPDAA